MGKVQSKQGECYVLNAHLNPVCQLGVDEDNRRRQKMSLTSSPSSKFCSELALSLCDVEQGKSSPEKHPLKVYLPPKDCSKQTEDNKPEKAEEEKSEKEERRNNNLKESQSDNAEFSFTLYDFNGHGQVTRDDVERVVGRTISEALEKSLNLSSSNHTIQVHLAISPENNSKNKPGKDKPEKETRVTFDKTASKFSDFSNNLSHPFFSPGKSNRKKYFCDQFDKKPPNVDTSSHPNHSPYLSHQKSHRKFSLTDDRSPSHINEEAAFEQNQKNCHHTSTCRRAPVCVDHHSHYLDLAGIENYTSKFATTSSCLPTPECPRDILDRIHANICSRSHRGKEGRFPRHRRRLHNKQIHPSSVNTSPHLFRHCKEQRCNLLDVNFDLSDLVPEEKFDWEQYGRSKSYDTHRNAEYLRHSSPKQRHHSTTIHGTSPSHHRCHKHKEHEKELQWNRLTKLIEKDFSFRNQKENPKFVNSPTKDKCEHHHIHEHYHHHYHHYMDT